MTSARQLGLHKKGVNMTGQAPQLPLPCAAPAQLAPALVESHPQATKEKEAETEKCLKNIEGGEVSQGRSVKIREE